MNEKIMMVAGPNGSGKTTIITALVSQHKDLYEEFLNADQIAQGLAPLNPESANLEAGKLMIKRFHNHIELHKSFIFETTAAGVGYVRHLTKAKEHGYRINLLFLWLPGPEQAIKRVAARIKLGGHGIPLADIERRYYRGLRNLLHLYLAIADTVLILNNSDTDPGVGKVIALKPLDGALQIKDALIWERMKELAHV